MCVQSRCVSAGRSLGADELHAQPPPSAAQPASDDLPRRHAPSSRRDKLAKLIVRHFQPRFQGPVVDSRCALLSYLPCIVWLLILASPSPRSRIRREPQSRQLDTHPSYTANRRDACRPDHQRLRQQQVCTWRAGQDDGRVRRGQGRRARARGRAAGRASSKRRSRFRFARQPRPS
jgi:hypothetical protein